MKWMVPINQLDATQERAISDIVDNVRDDHLVSGFAGSGKTIVLTHVVERLAALPGKRKVCFATFTHALKDMVTSGLSTSALRKTKIMTFDALAKDATVYDILIADELQDLMGHRIKKVAARYESIVAAADFNQRIFRFAAKRPEINKLIADASTHQLGEIHRINENIFQIATMIHPDAAPRREPQLRDDDEKARFYEAPSKREEFRAIYAEASRLAAPGYPSAVLFPDKIIMKKFIDVLATAHAWGLPPELESNADEPEGRYDAMNAFLDSEVEGLQIFGSGSGEMALSDDEAVVYLMTYHSSKGLDFPNVFLPHLTDDTSLDPVKNAKDEEERRLFFVAVTRARQRLYLSFHGTPHRFLEEIPWDYVDEFSPARRSY
jgi:superfamily I DNA/RNA helicase